MFQIRHPVHYDRHLEVGRLANDFVHKETIAITKNCELGEPSGIRPEERLGNTHFEP